MKVEVQQPQVQKFSCEVYDQRYTFYKPLSIFYLFFDQRVGVIAFGRLKPKTLLSVISRAITFCDLNKCSQKLYIFYWLFISNDWQIFHLLVEIHYCWFLHCPQSCEWHTHRSRFLGHVLISTPVTFAFMSAINTV